MKHILALTILVLLLAGCGGDFASPTTITTEITTTTETQTAAQEQSHNRQVCVGLLNIGSCNTAQSNVQNASRPAGSPAPAPVAMDTWTMITTVFALLAAFGVALVFGMLLLGNEGYN